MELIVVLALALAILGPKRLPETGRSLGRGVREFKQSLTGGDEDQRALPLSSKPSGAADVRARRTNRECADQPSHHDSQVARLHLGIDPAGSSPRPRNRPRRWGA